MDTAARPSMDADKIPLTPDLLALHNELASKSAASASPVGGDAAGAKKCKHQTGEFEEYVDAIHTRVAVNGKLDKDSIFMNNEFGNISGYLYTCWGCKRQWKYGAPNQRSLPKWLRKLHYDVFEATRRP